MEFKVSRASSFYDEQPIDEAYDKEYTTIDIRTCRTFEEFDKKLARTEGKFTSRGEKHKEVDGYIQREFPKGGMGWFIKIDSIDDILKLQDKYGKIIIRKCWDNKNIYELEIYDHYL